MSTAELTLPQVAEALAAAREVLEGWDRYIEAIAGRGHDGPHEPEPLLFGDCLPCTSARYGTEVEMAEYAIPRLRAALYVAAEATA